ncbi:TPA: hypothetical protein LVM22_001079 [Klebsiella oxytoca]|nr:hypothetical protein [Klebsiella oxytoca]
MNNNLPCLFFMAGMMMPFKSFASEDISCDVYHSLYHDTVNIKATYRFIFKENSGIIMINGRIISGGNVYTLSRDIFFAYKDQGKGIYLLINKSVHKKPLDNTPDLAVSAHYPLFFTKSDKSMVFNIHAEGKGYIMSFVDTPLFYCNRR